MSNTSFKVNREADVLGTFLVDETHITASQMEKVFGPPVRDCVDFDKGYSGNEWFFESDYGVFTVYERWGTLHIGARGYDHVEEFKNFLDNSVK